MNKYIIALLVICCQLKMVSSQNFKFGKVSKEELEETAHPSEPDANAAVLYRKFRTTFQYPSSEGFTGTTEIQERIKIYNKEGNDKATVSVFLYKGKRNNNEVLNGLKAYTYNYDGGIEKIKLSKKEIYKEEVSDTYTKVTFTMPNIKKGSIIEYEYSVRTPFINTFDKFYFQESIPVNKVEMTFAAPEYLEYKVHRNGWIPFNIDETSKNRTLTLHGSTATGIKSQTSTVDLKDNVSSVSLNNVPSLKKEPYSGNINNYRSTLQFELSATRFPDQIPDFYTTTWEDVVKRIYNSSNFGDQLSRKGYFKDDVDQLIAGLSKKEATIKIYDYVKTKMTWDGNYGIYVNNSLASSYKNKMGNLSEINLLLVAMLKYAGIDASPVILGTKSNGVFLFPTRSGFNAVIAAANVNDELLLLDASDKMSSPNVLNPEMFNLFGGRLLKDKGVSEKIDLTGKLAFHNLIVDIKIDEDGLPMLKSNSQYTNNVAYSMRNKLSRKDITGMTKVISSYYDDYEIFNLEAKEVNNVYKPLKISFEAEVEDYLETLGNKIYMQPLAFYAMKANVFKSEERKLPIDYEYGRSNRSLFKIIIPEGYKVENLPKSISVTVPSVKGAYKYMISHNGNLITVVVQRSFKQAFISSESYNDLKSFYETIVAKENEKIVLSKI